MKLVINPVLNIDGRLLRDGYPRRLRNVPRKSWASRHFYPFFEASPEASAPFPGTGCLLRTRLPELDVLLHPWHAVLPVIFVLNRGVAVEFLFLQLPKACRDLDDPLASDCDFGLPNRSLVLEVDADDAAFEDAEALDGDEVRGAPVADIGADADALIAAFDYTEDVKGVQTL